MDSLKRLLEQGKAAFAAYSLGGLLHVGAAESLLAC